MAKCSRGISITHFVHKPCGFTGANTPLICCPSAGGTSSTGRLYEIIGEDGLISIGSLEGELP